MQIARNRSEAQQVVNDDMHGAAHRKSFKPGHIQCLGGNALSRKRGVAMHRHGNDFFSPGFSSPRLFGSGASHGHRIHSFQMAWIGDQMDSHFVAVRCGKFAGRAHVILHVSAAQHAAWIDVFEPRENFRRASPDDMHHHVQAPAVTHGQNGLLRPFFGCRA